MKQSYFIIVLDNSHRYLVDSLDDSKSKIYLHIDLEMNCCSENKTRYAKLNILFNRLNVRWKNGSQIIRRYILLQKQIILMRFKRAFCGVGYFNPCLLKNNMNFRAINEPLLLYNDFEGGSNPTTLDKSDMDILLNSDYLFARKFADKNIEITDFLVSKK